MVSSEELRDLAATMRECGIQRVRISEHELEIEMTSHVDGPIPVEMPETEEQRARRYKDETARVDELLFRSAD